MRNNLLFTVLLVLSTGNGPVWADDSLSSGIDCTEINVDYTENPHLTRAEKIDAMEKAFYESVSRFEICNSSTAGNQVSNAGSNTAGLDGTGMSGDDGDGDNGNGDESNNDTEGVVDSVSDQVMAGTETELESVTATDLESVEKEVGETDTNIVTAAPPGKNGTTPEDIPDANNDDIVAAQIRLAAESEKDPEKREKLWQEYRKYKGI